MAPRWNLQIHDKDALSPGYLFVAPYRKQDSVLDYKWIGPLIYDQHGDLIWSGAPMFNYVNTFDFRGVQVNGTQMASLIVHENDAAYLLDNTYELHQTIPMISEKDVPPSIWQILKDKNKKTNFHDFRVSEDGARAFMLTKLFENTTVEESKLVGYEGNCSVIWQGIKEVDISTNQTLFVWSAHGHIAMDEGTFALPSIDHECELEPPDGWGITHFNSIDRFANGDYLVSARHTDTIYRISQVSGAIIWRLGGVKSDFQFIGLPNSGFSRQHHARIQSQNVTHTTISLFDNAHSDNDDDVPTNRQSRGLLLSLNTFAEPMTASVIQEYNHPDAIIIPKRGSVQILPNNNAFICWSAASALTEHASDGRVLMEAHFELNVAGSYRGYKVLPWIGQPSSQPDVNGTVSECDGNACTIVYVSWNGATEVAKWNVYQANGSEDSAQLASFAFKSGFETRILFDGQADYVIVEGVDRENNILGRSQMCKTTEHEVSVASEASLGKTTILAFLCGIAVTVITSAAVWLTRWHKASITKYGLLAESDDEGDSDLEEEEFEHLRLGDLPLGLYSDQPPKASAHSAEQP